jgi:hypothetical protein
MKPQTFLFIHQNFPAQFVHVAGELRQRGHEVVALAVRGNAIPGVRFIRYSPTIPERVSEIEPARDFETKLARASACAAAMRNGKDVFQGGVGADKFVFGLTSGSDTIVAFSAAEGDQIQLTAGLNGSSVNDGASALAATTTVGTDAVIDLGSGNYVTLLV